RRRLWWHVWRLPRVRVRAARKPRLRNALEEDLVVAPARDVAAVVRAHVAGDHPWRWRPHRRPRALRVVLLEEWLPDGDADVLAEQHGRRALPARRWEVRREVRVSRVALRTVVDVHQRGGNREVWRVADEDRPGVRLGRPRLARHRPPTQAAA